MEREGIESLFGILAEFPLNPLDRAALHDAFARHLRRVPTRLAEDIVQQIALRLAELKRARGLFEDLVKRSVEEVREWERPFHGHRRVFIGRVLLEGAVELDVGETTSVRAERDRRRDSLRRALEESLKSLSPRRREVVRLWIRGCSTSTIARTLGIEAASVRVERKRAIEGLRGFLSGRVQGSEDFIQR
jgi:RNA polymerase sigma factor (sigma-70 family)